jgi:predicted enzyme related to lactoylglutathione lyase
MASGAFPLLNVSDLDRAAKFYGALGLKAKIDSVEMDGVTMRWAIVEAGGAPALMLTPRDFPGADPEDVKWASGDVGKGVLVNLGVPSAKRTHAKAQAAGATPSDLMANPWGGHSFQVAEPDGYYVGITDRLPVATSAGRGAKKAAKKAGRKPTKKAGKKGAKKAGKARRR